MAEQELFQVVENPNDLALDECVVVLKELCELIKIDKMDFQDKLYLNEICKIISEMETPVLISEGSA